MQIRRALQIAILASAVQSLSASAALTSYGYVKGTFVPGSNYLEPIDQMGTFLHYHFKVATTNGEQYEAVIDVKKGQLFPFPQRILNISAPELYGPVLSSDTGFHPITMTANGGNPAQGALDYMRHPGILNDMTTPWVYLQATPTQQTNVFTMPEWDALFVGVQKIYAFGQPFTGSAKGVHVVHQNQGDKKSTFFGSNALYQDGAVIFEYADGRRKVLLTRFDDQPNDPGQSDFSWDSDPDGGGPLKVGAGRAPIVVETSCSTNSAGKSAEQCVFGPFAATQIEAETLARAFATPVYLVKSETGALPLHEAAAAHPAPAIASTTAAGVKSYRRAYSPATPSIPSYFVQVPVPSDDNTVKVTIRYVP